MSLSMNTYLLPTEFKLCSVWLGPSFFLFNLWPKAKCVGHKSRGNKNEDP